MLPVGPLGADAGGVVGAAGVVDPVEPDAAGAAGADCAGAGAGAGVPLMIDPELERWPTMASAFGGGGSSQTAFGARSGATVLTRATTVLGALFMLGAIILGVFGQRGPGSIMSGARTTPAPAPASQTPGK